MFEVIRDAPDTEGWVCFHSYALAHHPTKRHGEVDFVLLTRHGVFALEVKGGGIGHDHGVWSSVDRNDKRHELTESPFKQAADGMHALERRIKEDFTGRKTSRALFGFGVIFPDVEFTKESPEWDNRVVYDSRDREKPFTSYVNRLAQFHRSTGRAKKRPSLRPDAIEELTEYLRPNFDLVPAANLIIDGIRKELNRLTLEQRDVLANLDTESRVIVHGGVLFHNAVVVSHDGVIGEGSYLSPGVVVSGFAEFGSGTFIGSYAVVPSGVRIGDRVKVGIGTAVTADVPDGTCFA